MPSFTPPLRDYQFVLHETLRLHEDTGVPVYETLQPDLSSAVLTEAGRLSTEVLAPANLSGDAEGCVLEGDSVRTPRSYKDAWRALRDGGWPSLECDEEYGGQGMPTVLSIAVGEMHSAANMALMMYQGLTHGAYSAIHKHGSPAQKQTYLPRLASGEWTGTMNLTEPQCGTDLGLIKTKAEPQPDGSYKITGSKIFISAGEHDLAENIIHLVLAKIPGGPEGVKGISLFVCPKNLFDEDGALTARNAVRCGRLEHKMGIHGNATCEMIYDGATAWLVGEEHKGLRAMFVMMNEARILVGMQGLGQALAAYQVAADYARDRLQGRDVTGPQAPERPADPIIVHPDIRRTLMDQKAFIEGARAFILWGATLIDGELRAADDARRAADADMIALLTPVLKAYLTDKGYECAAMAQQVLGGHGYIEEWGLSQMVRDARIAMIYEGANGVQALDLVGRKLPREGGKAFMRFLQEARVVAETAAASPALKDDFAAPLAAALDDLQAAAMHFMTEGLKNPNEALAGSNDFLHLFGLTGLALMWTRMASTAQQALERDGGDDRAFYEAKLATGRYFMAKLAPETALRLARVKAGAATVMALPAEAF